MVQTFSPTSFKFTVQRGRTELVTPAKPTPYEFKPLSDLDSFRNNVYGLMFFSHNPSMNGVDPAKVIRAGIAQTLVFYYPLAGRLREDHATGRLTVECTGEGILFTEADADVTLDQFGYPLVPPFSCSDQLLYEEPSASSSYDILNCPLVLIQVTLLKCGGFIFGIRYSHAMCDGSGAAQFMSAIGEIARGATSPLVLPVWERLQVLNFTKPVVPLSEQNNNPDVSDVSTNNDKSPNFPLEQQDLCYKAFIFRPHEISALRRRLPLCLLDCSSFEIITAAVWKCRVAALQPRPTEEMSLIWAVNLRRNHFIPTGYYGNAVGLSISTSIAKEILENPLCYTLQLMRNAKEKDQKGTKDSETSCFRVTDLKYAGFEEVDFRWGKAIYAGFSSYVSVTGFYQMLLNRKNGEIDGITLPFCMPNQQAMERFEMELNNMFKDHNAIISKL